MDGCDGASKSRSKKSDGAIGDLIDAVLRQTGTDERDDGKTQIGDDTHNCVKQKLTEVMLESQRAKVLRSEALEQA